MRDLSRFTFGATSAITTSIAIVVGLGEASNAKMTIIGSLLIIAFADNISDSFGIHVYKESECYNGMKRSKVHTITNFVTRLVITLLFVSLFVMLPTSIAVLSSVIAGLVLLIVMSYMIAISRKENPVTAMAQHLSIAVVVLIASHFLGILIRSYFLS